MKIRPAVGWLLAFLAGSACWAWAIEAASRQVDTAHRAPIMIAGFLIFAAV